MHCFPLLLLSLFGSVQDVDDFRYANAASAQAAWVAGEGAPPVEVVTEAGRPTLKLGAPFASQSGLRRVVIDRQVELDLAASGRFLLEVAVDDRLRINPQPSDIYRDAVGR